MRIIVWGINYAPEPTGIAPYNTALCEFLAAKGHEVNMVTAFPYYPAWKKQPEDEGCLFRTDRRNEVNIHRCWHYVPRKVASWKRIIHEATFVLTSFLRTTRLPKADVMIVISPPLLLGTAAWLISKIKGMPFLFHVQDLQPDAAMGLGLLKRGPFLQMLYRMEAFAYRKAVGVSGISHSMVSAFMKKGVPKEKLAYFPNGVRLPEPSLVPERGRFRARHQIQPDEFLVVYSGNLGIKQGLDVLVKAAALIKNNKIQILISGDGAYRQRLLELVGAAGLPHLAMLPIQPEDAYQEMLVDADVCLVTQQAKTGGFFFPSKLLTTLAFRKPVISVADDESEVAVVTKREGFGVSVRPSEPALLAESIVALANDRALLSGMGQAGFEFVRQFDMTTVLSQFEERLKSYVEADRTKS